MHQIKTALQAKQVGRVTPCAPSRIARQPVCAGRITKTRHPFAALSARKIAFLQLAPLVSLFVLELH
ncbi:MAG: hypothetical protein DME76_10665 [Verrucomicrobia bacterium]|nr:MAG: hypothetical protein DME76_10665 [Verrucomicrobiota bacterium]